MSENYKQFWINKHSNVSWTGAEYQKVTQHEKFIAEDLASYIRVIEYAALQACEARLESANEKIDNLLKIIERLKEDDRKVVRELKDTIAAQAAQIASLEAENTKLAKEVSMKDKFVKKLTANAIPTIISEEQSAYKVYNDLKSENSELKAEIEERKKASFEAYDKLDDVNIRLEEQVADLKSKVEGLEAEIQKQNETAIRQCEFLDTTVKQCSAFIEKCTKENSALQASEASLKSDLAELVQALSNWYEWEQEQIRKEGPYVGAKINELINGAREALKKAKHDRKDGGSNDKA